MNEIKDVLPDVPSAVRAMIDGLRNREALGIEIDMTTFGSVVNGVCFGCAATCTLLQAGLLDIKSVSSREISEFESRLDMFRRGYPFFLQIWYGESNVSYSPQKWCLCSHNWEEQLPEIEAWLEKVYGG